MNDIRITVFCEHHQDRYEPVKSVYPDGIHAAIAAAFAEEPGFQITIATQDMPSHGLTNEVLECTDVLIWWSHIDNHLLDDTVANEVCRRVVRDGMGFIALHSASFSKPWQRMLGIEYEAGEWGRFRTMPKGEKERLWVVAPGHPICEGLGDFIEIPQDEMYGEPMLIPEPDKLLFIAWWEGGEVCRSGTLFERGRGKIFGFTPGHEEFPIYHQSEIRRVLRNAVRFLAPAGGAKVHSGEGHLSGEAREDLSHRM
ncbi:ThuA domain-containing protein [Paenibacillus physcomitrellae]|uniref:Trehalose utilization protein ThuA n=1 Tax=Paenibacillus physcomitrellae TaxID=1619311 RepID=A0ABQ1G5E6_9BACL|nr:ThuA domain-containing protein [Paenibacillus physcomitrellae]GGA37183.1 trehalose utilization protein ThuA [Paenibacillus physcomitrellae]